MRSPQLARVLAAAFVSSLSTAAFAQVTLPDGSPNPAFPNLYAWWRADVGVNASAGMPADGTAVTRWEDSGNRNHDLVRVATDVTQRPTFRATLANGDPAVDFDGNDYIWAANTTAEFGVISAARTVICVARLAVSDGGYIFDSSSSAGRTAVISGELATPSQWVLFPGNTPSTLGGPVFDGGVTMVSATVAAGAQSLHVNGQLKGTGTSAMQSMSGILLGGRFNLQNRLKGSISEVLVFDKALDATERAAIESYLSDKYQLDVPPPPLPMVDVFVGGEGGYPVYRIPAITQLESGRLVAFAEGRVSGADNGSNDMVMRASDDLGATWAPVFTVDDQPGRSLNNPCVVEVRDGAHAGRVILMYQSYPTGCGESCVVPGYKGDNICKTFIKTSDDGGATWSDAIEVTSQVKRPTVVTSVASGPGVGIQLRHGANAGRLVIPFNQGPYGSWACYAVYSDDGGDTWAYGAIAANGSAGTGNEVQMVERADGSIMLNSRQFSGGGWRKTAVSSDGGATWSPLANDDELPDPSCMAGLVALTDPIDGFDQSRIVFSGPNSASARSNGFAWLSTDGGLTWPVKKQVYYGPFAYSLPVSVDCDRFGVFFEKDGYTRITLAFVDYTDFTNNIDDFSDEGTCVVVACPADLDGSGEVDASDLASVLGEWGATKSSADIDGDGSVGASDLAVLLGAWGPCGQ